MKVITFLVGIIATLQLPAQKHDYNVLLGYRSNDTVFNSYRGITRFDFNTASLNPRITYDSFRRIDFDWTINNMSDVDGQYLFSYNGFIIEDSANQVIKNGMGDFTRQTEFGDVVYQSGLILPLEKHDNYMLLHEYNYIHQNLGYVFSDGLHYSIIDLSSVAGKTAVVQKNKIVISDTLDPGRTIAIRHANGRDWWILKGKHDMLSFYTFLLTRDTIYKYGLQVIGERQYIPFGCVAVSQQGDKIVYISQHEGPLGGQGGVLGLFLHFFDFDRCTGLLANPKSIQIDGRIILLFGGAFSPNGKFFYVSRAETMYQIDMTRPDIILDTVAIYDGFSYISPGNVKYHTWFGFIQPLPDGRIYGSTSNSGQQYAFYINKPNEKGRACDVRQHSLKITAHTAFPDFPNYRLGPIDGSACDTLNINNSPVSEFRYDQDSTAFLKIEFTNLSYYEPTEFWWDWGDATTPYYTTNKDTSILHTFTKEGVYRVCLHVKNSNGEHTTCKELKLGTTGTKDVEMADQISIYPNPVSQQCVIHIENYLPKRMSFRLFNIYGHPVLSERLFHGSNILDMSGLNAGIYLMEIKENGLVICTKKLIKL